MVIPDAIQVGDTVEVTFKNTLTFPVNLFPDGGLIPADTSIAQAVVMPGNTTTYEWTVCSNPNSRSVHEWQSG